MTVQNQKQGRRTHRPDLAGWPSCKTGNKPPDCPTPFHMLQRTESSFLKQMPEARRTLLGLHGFYSSSCSCHMLVLLLSGRLSHPGLQFSLRAPKHTTSLSERASKPVVFFSPIFIASECKHDVVSESLYILQSCHAPEPQILRTQLLRDPSPSNLSQYDFSPSRRPTKGSADPPKTFFSALPQSTHDLASR